MWPGCALHRLCTLGNIGVEAAESPGKAVKEGHPLLLEGTTNGSDRVIEYSRVVLVHPAWSRAGFCI